MGWGTSWDKFTGKEIAKAQEEGAKEEFKIINDFMQQIDVDLASGHDQAVLTTFEDGEIKHRIIPREELYNNLKPTHDPYTNPNAHIYYECECGQKLDPKTKRFAELNNCASNASWKIRWGEKSYIPYCPKCVEAKGIE